VGPVSSVDVALDTIATTDVDGAIVDLNLGGQTAFLVADVLTARHVPFVFATATSARDIPARYADVPHVEKPFLLRAVWRTLERTMCPAKH
jgi:hypothetical protein